MPVFEHVRTRSDPFGPVRMRSDAFGCVRMRSDSLGCIRHRPRRGGVDPREISPCRRRSAATTPRRRHDGAAAPSQRRDAEKTEKNDVKIMQNGPKMSQNGPKNDPKRFENDSKRAETRLFYFFGRRHLPKHLPPSSQRVNGILKHSLPSRDSIENIPGVRSDPGYVSI